MTTQRRKRKATTEAGLERKRMPGTLPPPDKEQHTGYVNRKYKFGPLSRNDYKPLKTSRRIQYSLSRCTEFNFVDSETIL
ncbi:hypothetical protein BD560DRAFT_193843 [Blakeslea trispora]|nr:hypothetical protein BD560DRAFT_193843 [Blakeslea trispora]